MTILPFLQASFYVPKHVLRTAVRSLHATRAQKADPNRQQFYPTRFICGFPKKILGFSYSDSQFTPLTVVSIVLSSHSNRFQAIRS